MSRYSGYLDVPGDSRARFSWGQSISPARRSACVVRKTVGLRTAQDRLAAVQDADLAAEHGKVDLQNLSETLWLHRGPDDGGAAE